MTYSESNHVTFLKVLKIYNAAEAKEDSKKSLFIKDDENDERTFS
jgi:hypothetical protein